MVGRRFGGAALAVALVVGLAGCGDDDDDGADASVDDAGGDDSPGDAAAPVEIVMREYSYAVSDDVPLGGTIRVVNEGEELHMLGVGRFRDGMDMSDLQSAVAADDEAAVEAVVEETIGGPSGLFPPGRSADLTMPGLEAGEYALICFIPTVGSGAPHFAVGMVAPFTVSDEEAEAPDADVELAVTPGEAIEGPDQLDAGRHTFGFTIDGDGSGLEPVLLRVPDGEDAESVLATIDEHFETAFSDEAGPPAALGAELADLLLLAAFDIGPTTTFQLGVDLEPGRYALVLSDTDVEGPGDITTRYEFTVT